MKKIILTTLGCVLALSISATTFSDKDTVDTKNDKTKPYLYKSVKPAGPILVSNLSLFVDSVNKTIPDSMPFFDWITDDIHQKKFNSFFPKLPPSSRKKIYKKETEN